MRENGLFKSSVSDCAVEVVKFVYSKLSILDVNEDQQKKCFLYTKKFVSLIFQKWVAQKRTLRVFLNSEESWLSKKFQMPVEMETNKQKSQLGRPEKIFQESGLKSKKRKIRELMNKSSEELFIATEAKLRQEGKRSMAEAVKKVVGSSPKTLKKLKVPQITKSAIPYTPEEALALITELKLTKHQYKNLQKNAKERNANIYPSYDSILEAKKRCYPPITSITITETLAEIKLQPVLDFTVQRLSEAQREVFDTGCESGDTFECTWKWGVDGSGGHSRYKQNFLVNAATSDSDIRTS